jgi:hypothetical protein
MRIPARIVIFVAGLVLVTASAARGYPISPVTLWSLVERSETVVYAEVFKVENHTCRSEEGIECKFSSVVATLHVLETWKGPAAELRPGVEVPASLAGTSKTLSTAQGVYVTVSWGRLDAVAFSPEKKPM